MGEVINSMREGIKAHRNTLEERRTKVVEATLNGEWWTAAIALEECVRHDAAIKELEFQLDSNSDSSLAEVASEMYDALRGKRFDGDLEYFESRLAEEGIEVGA